MNVPTKFEVRIALPVPEIREGKSHDFENLDYVLTFFNETSLQKKRRSHVFLDFQRT